jgi:hypothetical protein
MSTGTAADSLSRLITLLRRFNALDSSLADPSMMMFDDNRFVEIKPNWEHPYPGHLRGLRPREHLVELLHERRPIGLDAEHDAVHLLDEPNGAHLRAFLNNYRKVDRHTVAVRIRQTLARDLESRVASQAQAADAGDVGRALHESFLLAEFGWALSLAGSGTTRSPVVVASVEACASIGGTILMLPTGSATLRDEGLLERIHHARMVWIGVLLRFDAHPDLVAEGGTRLNERLSRLIGRDNDPGRGLFGRFLHLFEADEVPLTSTHLSAAARHQIMEDFGVLAGDYARAVEEDEELAQADEAAQRRVLHVEEEEKHRLLDVAARLLLPRYLIDEAVGVLQYLGTRSVPVDARLRTLRQCAGRWAWPLVPPALTGLGLLLLASLLVVRAAFELRGWSLSVENQEAVRSLAAMSVNGLRFLAFSWVVFTLFALIRRGRSASYLLMLRVPSATVFGLAILLALSFTWIGTQSGFGRLGPVVALAAALVYSMVEFINQGGDHRKAFRPAFDLTIIAAGTSLLASTLVLDVFGRALLTQVAGYDLLADPLVRLETLAILSSVSLALGTFLQAIWDEQTITAPLSHLRLRG